MRRPDWVSRLWGTARTYQNAPFSYRKHYCGLFAARCVDGITGSDWERELTLRGKRDAEALLSREGGIEQAVTNRLGNPVDGHGARRGDVCLVDVEGGKGLGVCMGTTIAVAAEKGLEFYPLDSAHKHWRVG